MREISEEEKAQFVGAKGEAFYRFRASFEEGDFPEILPQIEVLSPVKGNRSELLKHSRLDEKRGGEVNVLKEILGGRGAACGPQALIKQVLPHYKDPNLEKALPLEEEVQKIIQKGPEGLDDLRGLCSRITLGDRLLIFGKIPKVNPDIELPEDVLGKYGSAAAEFLGRDEVAAKIAVDKVLRMGSKELKENLVKSGALQIMRDTIALRQTIEQTLIGDRVENDIPWWMELYTSPKDLGTRTFKGLVNDYMNHTISDLTSALNGVLDERQKAELLELIENDEQFLDYITRQTSEHIASKLMPLREKVLEGIAEMGEQLPPFMTQMLEMLNMGSLGRREQPFWMEIVPVGNTFTVKLYLSGRGVLNRQVAGGHESVFRFEQIAKERLNEEFFFRFFTFQAFGEWQGDVYEADDVINALSDRLGKPPVGEVSKTAHTHSGSWGVLQEYGLKKRPVESFKIKFEAFCGLFQQIEGEDQFLKQKALELVEEAISLKDSVDLKVYFATLRRSLAFTEAAG